MKNDTMEHIQRLVQQADAVDRRLSFDFLADGRVNRVDVSFNYGGSLLATIWPLREDRTERINLFPGIMIEDEPTDIFFSDLLKLILDTLTAFEESKK